MKRNNILAKDKMIILCKALWQNKLKRITNMRYQENLSLEQIFINKYQNQIKLSDKVKNLMIKARKIINLATEAEMKELIKIKTNKMNKTIN